jgi:hypothetical protein
MDLTSCDQESLDYIQKMKRGEVHAVKITKARNYGHHKKLFACLRIGYENTRMVELTEDGYREYILLKSGHFFTNTFPDYVQFKAKSIAYDKLNKEDFEDLYPKAVQQVAKDLSITDKDLEEQILLEF